MIFALIFSIALIIANIVFFKNQKYLYLFIPSILFLPPYYGLDISPALPIISVARIMYCIFFVYVLLNKRRPFIPKNIQTLSKECYFIGIFFILRIISITFNMPSNSFALKALISLIFENLLLIYGIYLLAPTKEELLTVTKSIVYTGAVLFFVGIVESITTIRPFDLLYTVHRYVFNDHYVRLGYLRATTTMCMPNYFSNVCLFLAPVIFYLHRVTNQKRYLFFALLNFLALIHSGSRSNIIFYFFICTLYILFTFVNKKYITSTLRSFLIVCFSITVIVSFYCITDSRAEYFYSGTAKSLLNVIGFNFDLDEGAPVGSEGYGNNSNNATYSRYYQLSGVKNALSENPLFGIGYGALERGKIKYEWKGHYYVGKAIDSGFVEILIYEGLFGLVAYIFLYLSFIFIAFKNRLTLKVNLKQQTILLVIICYSLCLLSTTNMPRFLSLIIFYYLFINNSQEV